MRQEKMDVGYDSLFANFETVSDLANLTVNVVFAIRHF